MEVVNVEQLFHDLEQRYVRLREEHARTSSERDTLRDANATLGKESSPTRSRPASARDRRPRGRNSICDRPCASVASLEDRRRTHT